METKTDKYPNNLCFTDNLLLSESEKNLQKMIEELYRESMKVSLKVNEENEDTDIYDQFANKKIMNDNEHIPTQI